MQIDKNSPERYKREAASLEKSIRAIEEQIAKYRFEENRWLERKKQISEQLSQRLKEIDFIHMLLLEQKGSGAVNTVADQQRAETATFLENRPRYENMSLGLFTLKTLMPDHH